MVRRRPAASVHALPTHQLDEPRARGEPALCVACYAAASSAPRHVTHDPARVPTWGTIPPPCAPRLAVPFAGRTQHRRLVASISPPRLPTSLDAARHVINPPANAGTTETPAGTARRGRSSDSSHASTLTPRDEHVPAGGHGSARSSSNRPHAPPGVYVDAAVPHTRCTSPQRVCSVAVPVRVPSPARSTPPRNPAPTSIGCSATRSPAPWPRPDRTRSSRSAIMRRLHTYRHIA